MRPRIEVRPDDVDTIAQHMLEVEYAIGGDVPDWSWEDFADETREDWRRWARAAAAGAAPHTCNVSFTAWTAARGMARVLAERRQEGLDRR